MTPDLTSMDSLKIETESDCEPNFFDLSNSEHKHILWRLNDEITTSHILKTKYDNDTNLLTWSVKETCNCQFYLDHEDQMIKGYVAKTWLNDVDSPTPQNSMFETLIKSVAWLKVQSVMIETLAKEVKSCKKSGSNSAHETKPWSKIAQFRWELSANASSWPPASKERVSQKSKRLSSPRLPNPQKFSQALWEKYHTAWNGMSNKEAQS